MSKYSGTSHSTKQIQSFILNMNCPNIEHEYHGLEQEYHRLN